MPFYIFLKMEGDGLAVLREVPRFCNIRNNLVVAVDFYKLIEYVVENRFCKVINLCIGVEGFRSFLDRNDEGAAFLDFIVGSFNRFFLCLFFLLLFGLFFF